MISIQKPPFEFQALIGGRAYDGKDRIVVRSPYTGERVGSVPKLEREDVLRAMAAATEAAPALSRYERSQVLLRAAERIEKEKDLVARMITHESGLCLKDTRYEVLR